MVSFTFGLTFFISPEFSLRLGWDDGIGFMVEILFFALQIEIIYRLRSYFDNRFIQAPLSAERYSLELATVLLSSMVLVTLLITLPLYTLLEVMDLDNGHVTDPGYTLLMRQLYLLPITYTVLVYILLSAYYAVKNLNALELEAERLQKQRIQEMFENLRSQVNPEFLFNSLRALSSLIYRDKDHAASFVDELSAVYRYFLDHRDKELVELSKELQFLGSYLFLASIRHEGKLQCQINASASGHTTRYYLPPQTLQMVADTIIGYYMPVTVALDIHVSLHAGFLDVSANGQTFHRPDKNTLLGLREVISRYRYLTERKISCQASGTYVTIQIPLLEVETESSTGTVSQQIVSMKPKG
jgi:two-component system, LytTR family, sensor kinase